MMEWQHNYFSARLISCAKAILALFLISANTVLFAQIKLNLSLKDVPLKTAITEIEKKSGYKFVYPASLSSLDSKVSGEFRDADLSKMLQELFNGKGISFVLDGKQVVLSSAKQSTQSGKVKVNGVVTDENGDPFPFLYLYETSNPKNGAVTDDDGKYTLSVNNGSTITFSFMGYKTAVLPVGKSTVLNHQMEQDTQNLDEIVVVGFGQQSKASVSASVSSIKSDELIKTPVTNVTNAVAGRVAGITTMQSSGQPGLDNATIIVRGQGSWRDSSPLYVIDGVERSSSIFATMDANEIETFAVLKDAAATAVYGSRGANGVILITTKRGEEGRVAVNVNASLTMQQFTRYPDYLDSYNALNLYNEALMNDGLDPQYTKQELEHYRLQDDPYRYPNTNWYKLLMKNVAPAYNVSANVRGGSKTVRYFVSASYRDTKGQLKSVKNRVYEPQFSYKTYRISANVDALVTDDFTITLDFSGSMNDRRDPYSQLNLFKAMNRIGPWHMPAVNEDGSFAGTTDFPDSNPYWLLNTRGSDQRNSSYVNSSIKLAYDFNKWVKGLSVDARIAYDMYFGNEKYWTETRPTYRLISRPGRANRYEQFLDPVFFGQSSQTSSGAYKKLDGLLNIVYSRRFGNHSLRVQGIGNFSENKIGAAIPYHTVSVIGRVNYSYKNRYHVEANASYRGSENFAPGKRFGLFPSASVAWNVSEEKFMKNVKFIDNLKLRASVGMTGSDYVSERFLYVQSDWTTSTSGGPHFGHSAGGTFGSSAEPAIANPEATWEKATQINLGANITVWKDRLTLSYDRFWEKRRDILQAPNSVPSILGIGLPEMNIGKAERDGWELEASYRQKVGKDFNFWVKGNVSFVKNKVVFKDEPEGTDWWLKEEGKPIGQNWGYLVEGFFKSQEEIDNSPKQQVGQAPIPGDLKYVDYNGDGVIDTYDRVPIGYPRYPRYSYGISFGFGWRNWDFSALFQGTSHSSIFISDFLMYEFYNRGQVQDIHLGRWTPQTAATATYPVLHVGGNTNNQVYNTFFLKNNPYIRLKNVEIAYTLGANAAKKIGMRGLRVYLSGANLITWDDLKVVDPETPTGTANSVYPQARTFSLGVNLNF